MKNVSISETPEAITAEATAYVWQAYDAPRKRVPRARIVEHTVTVSIPKATEEAAPLAFVVEHFPEMVGRRATEYRAGYDQPIRAYDGRLYTPARIINRRRYLTTAPAYESPDPREYLAVNLGYIHGVSEHERSEYAEAIERHEVRADQYPATYDTAERIDQEAANISQGLIIIGGEIWQQCEEPAYEYDGANYWSGERYPASIRVRTTETDNPARNIYGALDTLILCAYHANVTRRAYIRVIRPDLVTIDRTARDLESKSADAARNLDSARARIEELEKELTSAHAKLEEAEAAADRAREDLKQYQTDPRAYWMQCASRHDLSRFSHLRNAAEVIRRELKNSR